jgi:hypothetical protein
MTAQRICNFIVNDATLCRIHAYLPAKKDAYVALSQLIMHPRCRHTSSGKKQRNLHKNKQGRKDARTQAVRDNLKAY